MRIDSSGRALVGTTAAISTSTANLQVVGSGATGSASFAKSDITTSGGSIVGIDAWAYDGSVYNIAGTINFRAAENWSSTNHGTDLQFRLVPSGAGAGLTERMRLTSGGNLAIGATARLYLDGSAGTGDTYLTETAANDVSLLVGGNTKMQALGTSVSVSTSATTILANAGGIGAFCVINGSDGSNRFCDLVLSSTSTAPTVVASYTALGSPAARTYTRSVDALQLAMASGTYTINSMKLGS
jgi:hypothetical protein